MLIGKSKTPVSIDKILSQGKSLKNAKPIYNLTSWKYGFSTVIPVTGEPQHIASYITKYICKDFKKIFGNYYYAGGNINRKPKIWVCDSVYEDIDKKEYICPYTKIGYKYLSINGGEQVAI